MKRPTKTIIQAICLILLVAQIIQSEGSDTVRTWDSSLPRPPTLPQNPFMILKSDGTLIIRRWEVRHNERVPWPCYNIEDKTGIKITNIIIEKEVDFIDRSVFEYCTDLVSINVDADNPSYVSIDGVLFRREWTTHYVDDVKYTHEVSPTLIRYPQGRQGAYAVPKILSIADFAFGGSIGLTSVTLPNTFFFGKGTFANCVNLTSVTLPTLLTKISDGMFSGCTSLTSITIPEIVNSIGKWAFADCRNLTSIIIPESVTTIRDSAFVGCRNLTSITIPSRVRHIGWEVFHGCTGLTSINVNEGNLRYASVDGVLFFKDEDNGKLGGVMQYPPSKQDTSYIIPKGIRHIFDNSFSDCINLTSVTIPRSIQSIGRLAFSGCRNLKSITVRSWTPPLILHNAFRSISDSACLYVPAIRVGAYRRAEGWKDFKCIKPIYSRSRDK